MQACEAPDVGYVRSERGGGVTKWYCDNHSSLHMPIYLTNKGRDQPFQKKKDVSVRFGFLELNWPVSMFILTIFLGA